MSVFASKRSQPEEDAFLGNSPKGERNLFVLSHLVVFESKSSVGGWVGGGSGHVHSEDERLLPAWW